MRHYSKVEWMNYINNTLSQIDREQYDEHLYSCDQCLFQYMDALDEQSEQLFEIEDGTAFTDRVITAVRSSVEEKVQVPKRFYHHSLFHYGIASIVTMMLMTTGIFQDMFTHASNLDSYVFSKQEASLSDKLMQKAVTMLDSIQPKTKGGFDHE